MLGCCWSWLSFRGYRWNTRSEPPPDSNLPNITSGTVDSRGRIVNDDYDYNIEPKKDTSGQFYFQKTSTAPEINLQPASSIACYDGAPAEFEVTVQTDDIASYLWQLSTDNGSTWDDLENNDTYSGVDTSKLTIASTSLSMNGYLFRVKINTDEYACFLYSQDTTKLSVEAIYQLQIQLTILLPVMTIHSVITMME